MIYLVIGSTIYPAFASSNDDVFFDSAEESSAIKPSEISALNALAQSVAFANHHDSGVDIDAIMASIQNNITEQNSKETFQEIRTLATDVSDIDMNLTKYGPDTDGDGIPDSVELILGTDINKTDSDFDQLDDLFEISNDLDPLEPDSNYDGLADYSY
ncbi:hypothetical protein [Methanolobus bombayensis]|uniref:hypothetical protein n=1 Tax=Methanolobus bombayensis TaxID=38023 RepID=UPI001AEAF81B|nr:hypothetical protein [Methanolobus bombayensis]MBP1909961.1 hypothetical protein [Methanolobus bombayensis]